MGWDSNILQGELVDTKAIADESKAHIVVTDSGDENGG